MKQEIKEFLIERNKSQGWGTSDADLRETLFEANEVHCEDTGGSRWWNNTWKVVEIDGRYFGYGYAYTTGDMSPREAGWEFEDSSITEVFKKIKVVEITTYE